MAQRTEWITKTKYSTSLAGNQRIMSQWEKTILACKLKSATISGTNKSIRSEIDLSSDYILSFQLDMFLWKQLIEEGLSKAA